MFTRHVTGTLETSRRNILNDVMFKMDLVGSDYGKTLSNKEKQTEDILK